MGDSNIEWTDKTWNPTRGCERISPGCQHCYAEAMAHRFAGPGQPYDGLVKLVTREVRQYKTVGGEPTGDFRTVTRTEPRWTGEVRFVPEMLERPLRWRKPQKIFVDSMSDLFHPSVTNEQIAAVFGVMAATRRHTYQILTKRADRLPAWFEWVQQEQGCPVSTCGREMVCYLGPTFDPASTFGFTSPSPRWPLPNVWLGVSVEDQQRAEERIPHLLKTPAAVRFLSCEPLLGQLRLDEPRCDTCGEAADGFADGDGTPWCTEHDRECSYGHWLGPDRIDWVIAGCESGAGARPAQVDWYRELLAECTDAHVPFFLKQATGDENVSDIADVKMGPPGKVVSLPYLDGAQHAAFPEPR